MTGVETMESLSHPPVRRVRHGIRDGLVVMAFSALLSVSTALLFALAVRLLAGPGGSIGAGN
ncbi:MAG TPA: hypothetical protein VF426_09455 [Marmoricola sp.]